MHHERLDGSGYHRQATAPAIALPARLLAAADVFHALIKVRAHRPARSTDEAASVLVTEAQMGRLDVDAVRAVVEAGGGQSARRLKRRTAEHHVQAVCRSRTSLVYMRNND